MISSVFVNRPRLAIVIAVVMTLAGALSLFHLVPVIGSFVVMAILAFSDWPNGEAGPRPAAAGGR